MKKLFKKIFLAKEIVSKDGVLHFRRWRLIETHWFNIYFHVLHRPDSDSDQHDHPWNFMSMILWNSYYELSDESITYRTFLSTTFNKAEKKHRIVKFKGEVVYTFVITGPRRREWGYHTELGWMTNQDYRNYKNSLFTEKKPYRATIVFDGNTERKTNE